ncbi:thiamine pyrophosphate-dependent enzyme [Pseudopelagicola sp. nBUS_20]|uniref:thiamine pyrophosphate-dependent enzyme n=1 Tax=Pseudopelagicola sp. nBUS_20 TaxID=3395317 RepID=UPI003EBA9CE3
MPVVRPSNLTAEYLKNFEARLASDYEAGKINGVIHLSDGNEEQLIEIFSRIQKTDWVFSAWRNHYHALLHGVPEDYLYSEIQQGRSMGIMHTNPNFFSSSIVCGVIPIALGAAVSLGRKSGNKDKIWCFVGDMTYESGLFWEAYKYSQNHDLPLQFVVEDNGKSVTTDTRRCWGGRMQKLDGVIYYDFQSKYPHHGTGKWVNF